MGSIIKALREKAGLTQEELGQKLGLGQSAIAMWETGERMPRTTMLADLARVLGCSADDLLRPQTEGR